jgi:hypothetical protein
MHMLLAYERKAPMHGCITSAVASNPRSHESPVVASLTACSHLRQVRGPHCYAQNNNEQAEPAAAQMLAAQAGQPYLHAQSAAPPLRVLHAAEQPAAADIASVWLYCCCHRKALVQQLSLMLPT